MKLDIYKLKNLEEHYKKKISISNMTEKNKELILKFYEDCILDGLSPTGLMKYFKS